jgi:hypothetical protein
VRHDARPVDALLKALAAVALDVSAAEAALDEGAPGAARDRLEAADAGLIALRGRWPGLERRERHLLGAAAGPVRARLDAARARLPRRAALSVGAAEHDPDHDADPLAQANGAG